MSGDPEKYVRKTYNMTRIHRDGTIEHIVMTPEKQRAVMLRCLDCDGDNTITEYDVRTEKEFNALDYDEQRKVAQGINNNTPIPVVIAALKPACSALNHEDEDYIPAIKFAINVLRSVHHGNQ